MAPVREHWGPRAGETGCSAQALVTAHGAPVGNGSPQWRGLTGWGDEESNPAGGRSSRCACGGWHGATPGRAAVTPSVTTTLKPCPTWADVARVAPEGTRDVVWCGVMQCVVVWCVVLWCGVPKALLPEGKGQDVLLTGIAKRAGMCACARSMWHLRGSWVRPFVWRTPCGEVGWGGVGCAEGAVTRKQWPGCLPTGTGKREGCVSKCVLCAGVLLYNRDQCTSALGRCCSADACARSRRVHWAHCTVCAALHYQYFVSCATVLGAVHCTALSVPCCTALVGSGQWKRHNAPP